MGKVGETVGIDESLIQVKRLLNMVPRVKVTFLQDYGPDGTCMTLKIRLQKSLACIAHFAIMANGEVSVDYKPGQPDGEWFDAAGLRYILWLPTDPEPVTPPSRLQIMGIFLARELKALGLLDPAESDRLQRAWNAVVE